MIVILTVIYTVVRSLKEYGKQIKSLTLLIFRVAVFSVIGTGISAIILIPICSALLGDARTSIDYGLHLFHPLNYYLDLPEKFITASFYNGFCLGFSIPILFSLFFIWLKRSKYVFLKVLFSICVVMLIFPFFAKLLNGMSYVHNRWVWGFSLLSAFILVVSWNELMNTDINDWIKLSISFICFSVTCLLYSRETQTIVSIGTGIIFMFLLHPHLLKNKTYLRGCAGIALICISVMTNASLRYHDEGTKKTEAAIDGVYVNDSQAVRQIFKSEMPDIPDDMMESYLERYRFSGPKITNNENILSGVSNTQCYWSISNPVTAEYRSEMDLREIIAFSYKGYDDRTALLDLSSVKYFIVPDDIPYIPPFGFSWSEERNVERNGIEKKYNVFVNDYPIPIFRTYDSYMPYEEWKALSSVQKQDAMLKTAVVYDNSNINENLDKADSSNISEAFMAEYDVVCSEGLTLEDDCFICTSRGASATISFKGIPDAELYVSFEGLKYSGATEYDFYHDDTFNFADQFGSDKWNALSRNQRCSLTLDKYLSDYFTEASLNIWAPNGIDKRCDIYTNDHVWYNNRHNITINMQYSDEPVDYLTLTFNHLGKYSFDSFNIWLKPVEEYLRDSEKLKMGSIEDVYFGVDNFCGSASFSQPCLLVAAVPYSEGWEAYIDGTKAEILKTNIMHMGLDVPEGDHYIEFVYHTPYLKLGAIISALSLVIFAVYILITVNSSRVHGQLEK